MLMVTGFKYFRWMRAKEVTFIGMETLWPSDNNETMYGIYLAWRKFR